MSGGFVIRPSLLNDASAEMLNVALNMDTALRQLREMLDFAMCGAGSTVPPWGTDEVGAEFGARYTETVATVFPAVESYQEQVAYGARTLHRAAGDFLDLNSDGAQNVAELRAQLPDWGHG